MSKKNIIEKGKDNDVVIVFTFLSDSTVNSLDMFDNIIVTLGTEQYSTSLTPTKVIVAGTKLILRLGDTTTLAAGKYAPTIIGYNTEYNDGYTLTSPSINPINKIEVI